MDAKCGCEARLKQATVLTRSKDRRVREVIEAFDMLSSEPEKFISVPTIAVIIKEREIMNKKNSMHFSANARRHHVYYILKSFNSPYRML